jgi:hypothetical protein
MLGKKENENRAIKLASLAAWFIDHYPPGSHVRNDDPEVQAKLDPK